MKKKTGNTTFILFARLGLLLFFMATLAGCGGLIAQMAGIPIVNPGDSSAVAKNIKVERDPDMGVTAVRGPIIFASGNIYGPQYFINSVFYDKSKKIGPLQLFLTVNAKNTSYQLDSAYSSGEKLKLTVLKRTKQPHKYFVRYVEQVVIDLPSDQLENYAKNGVSVKATGAEWIKLEIPSAYFSGYRAVYLNELKKIK